MPTTIIDTSDQVYKNMLESLKLLRTYIGPKIAIYVKLPANKRQLWRQTDGLLKETLRLVRDINRADAEAGEVDI